jgi:hypothetical protein
MKLSEDDSGKTIDESDNLPRMILIEQAIDAAYEIEETISQSYALCDCVLAITEYARETEDTSVFNEVQILIHDIANIGAKVRANCYYALALASFDFTQEAEKRLKTALDAAWRIKDDFDRKDAFLEISTTMIDVAFLQSSEKLVGDALSLLEELADEQKAYLLAHLSSVVDDSDRKSALLQEAIALAESITDPIIRSKTFLELTSLLTNFTNDVS